MNLNLLAYCIYGVITIYVCVYVGLQFHKNGYYYIESIFEEKQISEAINNLLLIGYYLVNLGYTIYSISQWHRIENIKQLIDNLSSKIAFILIVLSILNFVNISVLSFFRKQKSFNQ